MCMIITMFIAEILNEEESRGIHDEEESTNTNSEQGYSSGCL